MAECCMLSEMKFPLKFKSLTFVAVKIVLAVKTHAKIFSFHFFDLEKENKYN